MENSRRTTRDADRRPYRGKSKHKGFQSLRLPDSPLHEESWAGLTALQHVRAFIETVSEVGGRRYSVLRRIGSSSHVRATRLAITRCKVWERCGRVLCPVCARLYRIWIGSQALALRKKGVPSKTLVLLLKEVDVDDLRNVDIRKTLECLRKDLIRFGFKAVIGNLEAAYKPSRNTWVIHVHLLVFGYVAKAIEALRGAYKARLPDAVREDVIREEVRQITYLFKYHTYYRAGQKRFSFPMKRRQLEQLVGWTEGAKFTDLLFLLGFQKRGSIVAGRGFETLLSHEKATLATRRRLITQAKKV